MPGQTLHNPVIDPTVVEPGAADGMPDVSVLAVGSVAVAAETGPPKSYPELEASLAALDVEGDEALNRLTVIKDSLPDDTRQAVDSFENGYGGAADAARQEGKEPPSLADRLAAVDDLPESYRAQVLAFSEIEDRSDTIQIELERRLPEKVAIVKQRAIELEASLDYDKMVAHGFAADDVSANDDGRSPINTIYDVGQVIGIRRLLEVDGALDYLQVKTVERWMDTWEQAWQAQGLLHAGDEIKPDAEVITYALEDLAAIDEQALKMDRIRRDMVQKYKSSGHDRGLELEEGVISKLTRVMRTLSEQTSESFDKLHYGGTALPTNSRLRGALGRQLQRKVTESLADDSDSDSYAGLVEQARNIDAVAALDSIEIQGDLSGLPFEFDKEDLRALLFGNVPPLGFASVKQVTFRSLTPEEDKEDNTLGFHHWSDELGGTEIVISDAKVREDYQRELSWSAASENPEENARMRAKRAMRWTIIHEFGHELHSRLPLAAMKRWDALRDADPVTVTPYVKKMFDEVHPHRFMEDFAESMAMFSNRPAMLSIVSSTRYAGMQEIFEEFMPLYPGVLKGHQRADLLDDKLFRVGAGISDDVVRSIYLAHEGTGEPAASETDS